MLVRTASVIPRLNRGIQVGEEQKNISTHQVFTIVDQYTKCIDLVKDKEEKLQIIELISLLAILRCNPPLMNPPYIICLQFAHKLFHESLWKTHYPLALNLFTYPRSRI